MATNDSKANETQIDDEPLFKAFEWGHVEEIQRANIPGTAYASLATEILDICDGVSTILEMINRDDLEMSFEDTRPLLSAHHRMALTRLAVASMRNLQEKAYDGLEWADKQHAPKGLSTTTV